MTKTLRHMLDRTGIHVHDRERTAEHVIAPEQIGLIGIGERLAQHGDEALDDRIKLLRENLGHLRSRCQASDKAEKVAPTLAAVTIEAEHRPKICGDDRL